ncbi:unnamed protein product [Fusarium venenatum]|uniref:Zn(2)-C6 fungal-type domain-containing protein n=1 Tax=Fusarium venenatum TaxID=56646 RepID=A0A2L2U012_9HYPO|nr:uncharacterized protein FVRRES_08207 [Fusarium venenatum]CEI68130.1 unnamed protein product [Fusarium venenatum]
MDEALPEGRAVQINPGPPPSCSRRGDGLGIGVGPRTSTACLMCRDKKVKCSGSQPCVYCVESGLDLAEYENATSLAPDFDQCLARADSRPPASAHSPPPPMESRSTPSSGGLAEGNAAQQQQRQKQYSIPESPYPHIIPVPAVVSSPKHTRYLELSLPDPVLAPATSLSSSDTFSSELRNLLTERSRPNLGPVSAPTNDATPRSICQSRLGVDKIRHWPTEEDTYSMLNIVVLNVGISQHLFDVRPFSDNMSSLFGDDTVDDYPECLLIFAIGRLLQAKWDDESKPPGDEFFQEALKRMPDLSDLRKHGVLSI